MSIITALISILILAMVVQFLVDIIKEWLPEVVLRYFTPPLIAAAIGIVIAILFKVDVFVAGGYTSDIPIVSQILTGVILSAGSAAIHELIAKLRASRDGPWPTE
jgi:hypothetical protein